MTNDPDQIAELLGDLLNRMSPVGKAKGKNKRQTEAKGKSIPTFLQSLR